MKLYCTINNVNGGVLHVLQIAECMSCDAPPTQRQCSCGEDLLTLSEYHLIGAQATVKVNTQCVLYTLECVHSDMTVFV